MSRAPLRPLARILKARASGENPDVIEAANRARRHEAMADNQRQRAEDVKRAFTKCPMHLE